MVHLKPYITKHAIQLAGSDFNLTADKVNNLVDEAEEPGPVMKDNLMGDTALLLKKEFDPVIDQDSKSGVKGKKKKRRITSFSSFAGKHIYDHIKRKKKLNILINESRLSPDRLKRH